MCDGRSGWLADVFADSCLVLAGYGILYYTWYAEVEGLTYIQLSKNSIERSRAYTSSCFLSVCHFQSKSDLWRKAFYYISRNRNPLLHCTVYVTFVLSHLQTEESSYVSNIPQLQILVAWRHPPRVSASPLNITVAKGENTVVIYLLSIII